ncbi:hypothetical protein [Micromonospora sp. NPDC093244]|uniref:hypothetical protein n=1 Tax=Micromonospora sp. NPDC093244 TaxID=3155071 RepID=UPI003443F121
MGDLVADLSHVPEGDKQSGDETDRQQILTTVNTTVSPVEWGGKAFLTSQPTPMPSPRHACTRPAGAGRAADAR